MDNILVVFGTRDPEDRSRPRIDRNRRRPVIRHRGADQQGASFIDLIQAERHRPRTHPDQDRHHLGRHPRRGSPPKRRHQLQHDPALFPAAGRRLRRGEGKTDLAFRGPHSRLVQKEHRQRITAPRKIPAWFPSRRFSPITRNSATKPKSWAPVSATKAKSSNWPAATC